MALNEQAVMKMEPSMDEAKESDEY